MGEAKGRGTFEQRKAMAVNNAKPQKLEITCNPNELSNAECKAEDCPSTLFDKALIKKIVPITHPQNPTGKEIYLDQLVTLCRKCGTVFE